MRSPTLQISRERGTTPTLFGKVRPRVTDSRGETLSDFTKTLKPNYLVVYRDIALGYVLVIGALALAIVAERLGAPPILVALPGAIWVGYWIAYLQLFIHEGAHWNLAPQRETSDRLCNLLISWWAGLEVKKYRKVHFQHHRALGTVDDSEHTYFFPLSIVFIAKALLMVRVLEVVAARRKVLDKPGSKRSPEAEGQAEGPGLHKELVIGALVHALVVGVLLWMGFWGKCRRLGRGSCRVLSFLRSASPAARASRRARAGRCRLSRDRPWRIGARVRRRLDCANIRRRRLQQAPSSSLGTWHFLHAPARPGAFLNDTDLRPIMKAGRRRTDGSSGVCSVVALRMACASETRALAQSICPLCERRGTIYCQATDIEYFTTSAVFDFYLCSDCDLLYIHPVPSDRLDQIYPANYYSFVEGRSRSIVIRLKEALDARAFRAFLKRIPGDSVKVLDVGGGTGWLAGLLRDTDPRVESHANRGHRSGSAGRRGTKRPQFLLWTYRGIRKR